MTDERGHVKGGKLSSKVEGADMKVGPHSGSRRCVHDVLCRCVQEENRGEQLYRDNCSVLYEACPDSKDTPRIGR